MTQTKRLRSALARLLKDRPWPQLLLAAVTAWNRNALGRIAAAILLSWLAGAAALRLAEGGANPEFATWAGSLWNVWGVLFNGPSAPPQTASGRAATMLLLLAGACLGGLFTATVASVLVERY